MGLDEELRGEANFDIAVNVSQCKDVRGIHIPMRESELMDSLKSQGNLVNNGCAKSVSTGLTIWLSMKAGNKLGMNCADHAGFFQEHVR